MKRDRRYMEIPTLTTILQVIVNLKNICNLIGREEYNINLTILLALILYSLTKKQQNSNSVTGKNLNLLIYNEAIVNY